MPVDEAIGGDVSSASAEDLAILEGETPEATTEEPAAEAETPPPTETPTDESVGEVTEEEEEEEVEEVEEPEKGKKPPVIEEPEPEVTPTAKAIKAKYPDFFKNFPGVRGAIFRDMQFREFIATPDEAKELVERDKDFDEYEQQVMAGDPTLLLRTLNETDPQVMDKFVMNLIPTIEKFSPQLQGKMLFPYVRRILSNARTDAQKTGNKNLELSVGHLAKYLWNAPDGKIPEEAKRESEAESPEVKKLQEERDNARNALAQGFMTRVVNSGLTEFRKGVAFTFKSDKRFSPIEQDALVDKIVTQVRQSLDKDPRHNRAMASLWARAQQNGHSEEFVPRLVNAFLGGAKTVLPAVRAKIVADALKRKGIVQPAVGQQAGTSGTGGHPRGKGAVSSKDIDYSQTSDDDILSDDSSKVKLKKAGK